MRPSIRSTAALGVFLLGAPLVYAQTGPSGPDERESRMAPPAGGPGAGKNELGTVGSLDRNPGKASSSVLSNPESITTGGSNTGTAPVETGRMQGGEQNQGQPR